MGARGSAALSNPVWVQEAETARVQARPPCARGAVRVPLDHLSPGLRVSPEHTGAPSPHPARCPNARHRPGAPVLTVCTAAPCCRHRGGLLASLRKQVAFSPSLFPPQRGPHVQSASPAPAGALAVPGRGAPRRSPNASCGALSPYSWGEKGSRAHKLCASRSGCAGIGRSGDSTARSPEKKPAEFQEQRRTAPPGGARWPALPGT